MTDHLTIQCSCPKIPGGMTPIFYRDNQMFCNICKLALIPYKFPEPPMADFEARKYSWDEKSQYVKIDTIPMEDIFIQENGWFIPDKFMNGLAKDEFHNMMKIIKHGGMVDVVARCDGKEYRWQCDGLKYAKRHFCSEYSDDK